MGIIDYLLKLFGLTAAQKVSKMEEKGECLKLLDFARSDNEASRQKAIEALVNLAYNDRVEEPYQAQVFTFLEEYQKIPVYQHIRIREIQNPSTAKRVASDEYLKNGDYDLAIYAYNHALKLNPDDPEILNNLAITYSLKGDEDKARSIWEEVLCKCPDNQAARELLSSSYFKEAEAVRKADRISSEVERNLLKSLQVDPEKLDSKFLLAEFYSENGCSDKSLEHFKSCISTGLFPERFTDVAHFHGYIYKKMADVFCESGDAESAADCYKRALQVCRWEKKENDEIEEKISAIESQMVH